MQMFWLLIGGISFVLGAIGVPLPGWPTTIFWIIAAFCFANFNERGVLSRASKTGAIIGMLGGGAVATWALWLNWPWLALIWTLIAIGALIVLSRSPG